LYDEIAECATDHRDEDADHARTCIDGLYIQKVAHIINIYVHAQICRLSLCKRMAAIGRKRGASCPLRDICKKCRDIDVQAEMRHISETTSLGMWDNLQRAVQTPRRILTKAELKKNRNAKLKQERGQLKKKKARLQQLKKAVRLWRARTRKLHKIQLKQKKAKIWQYKKIVRSWRARTRKLHKMLLKKKKARITQLKKAFRLWRILKQALHKEKRCAFRRMMKEFIAALRASRKRIQNELKVQKGNSVKGRSSSSRHGLVVSMASHGPEVSIYEYRCRNRKLDVDMNMCFWCKKCPRQCLDHAHPACCTKTSTYSWTNPLNLFPSCRQCNQTKGGRPLREWLSVLEEKNIWNTKQVETFLEWEGKHKYKLLFGPDEIRYVEKMMANMNKCHELAEAYVKERKDPNQFLQELCQT